MLLEWVRRREPTFAQELERHLSRPGPIAAETEHAGDGRRPVQDLGLGNLRNPAGERA
jgi:hypothetical protein